MPTRSVGGALDLELLQARASRKRKLHGEHAAGDERSSTRGSTERLRAETGLTLDTLIWFVVKVPVLSEQITFVLPSVSTDGSERTMAFLRAIFFVPRARQVVMTAGRPSGMAATARATAI